MTLEEYKQSTGKTDAELAAEFGIERSQLTKFRTGRRTPSLAHALVIERITGGKVPTNSWDVAA